MHILKLILPLCALFCSATAADKLAGAFREPPDSARPGVEPSAIHLDLGEVQVMARVRVNGTDCGVVWTAPWRVDISRAVKGTANTLEIEVANLWPNRMIGDAATPERKFTQTTYRPYKADDALLSSGLLGPVRVVKMSLREE